jgi:hypothetical protein
MPDVPEQPNERSGGSASREEHELEVLAQGLREAFVPPRWDPVQIEAMDRAVLAVTVERAAAVRRRRLALRVGGWGALAAAAGLALAVLVWSPGRRGASSGPGSVPIAAGAMDINADGVVDILDALALSRMLREGAAAAAPWDITGDGVVDGRDVDALAAAAVLLGPEEQG